MVPNICSIENCAAATVSRGWCDKHYRRWLQHGDPEATARLINCPPEELFWSKVRKGSPDECWEWTAPLTAKGYGAFSSTRGGNKRRYRAHRFSYELHKGEIPGGFLVDHVCHNRACVNPSHLRLATPKENEENRRGATRRSKTGIRGVHWSKVMKKWHVQIGHHGSRVHVGYFDCIQEAEEAAIAARLELFTHSDMDKRKAE